MWFLIPIHFVIARTTISITTKKAETGDKHMQVDLFEHFAFFSYNGFLEDCTITLIDKTDGAEYCCLEVLYSCTSFINSYEARVLVM